MYSENLKGREYLETGVRKEKNLDLMQENYGMIHGLDSFGLKQCPVAGINETAMDSLFYSTTGNFLRT